MKTTSKIVNLQKSGRGPYILSVLVPQNSVNSLVSLKDDEIDVEIKKHSKKRSLNANAYAWVLMTQIAKEMSKDAPMDKWTVYKELLKTYSNSFEYLVVKEESLPRLEKAFRVIEVLGEGVLGKDKAYQVQAYYGSSTFTKEEMKPFIDGIVQEAKQLGIETETPEELERMVSLWESN